MDRFTEPILHVDMDAFFVEVERLRDPSLRGKAVVVGGMGRRSVVASASYEARESGVRSAMSMVEAERRCPHLVRVPPDHRRYSDVSAEVFAVLRSFTPHVEGLSVDEAFLDVSGLRLHFESPYLVAQSIRASLRESPGLPASVGIAPTKFLAKLASQEAKPDGIAEVKAGAELAFLHPLPVHRLWGVGQATHAALEGLAVATIGDVAALPQSLLERRLGPSLGAHLAALARGIDERAVVPNTGAKSISVEETFERDLSHDVDILQALASLCHRLDGRLRRSAARGHTATIKVRFADFTMVSRSTTQRETFAHEAELIAAAQALWARVDRAGRGVRLLGVGVAGLEPRHDSEQLTLDTRSAHPATAVVDEIRSRFGDDAVLPGRFVSPPRHGETPTESGENLPG
jgi:DNA polymerase-4